MKQLDSHLGRQIIFSRMISKNPEEYFSNLKNTYDSIPKELSPWSWSMREVLSREVSWYQTSVSADVLFNGLYRTVCNTYGFYNKNQPFSVEKIKLHLLQFPQRDRMIIENLREKYDEKIPIVGITTNKKEFFIYDGFHAAIARALDNKEVNLVFAYKKRFDCIFKRPNRLPQQAHV